MRSIIFEGQPIEGVIFGTSDKYSTIIIGNGSPIKEISFTDDDCEYFYDGDVRIFTDSEADEIRMLNANLDKQIPLKYFTWRE